MKREMYRCWNCALHYIGAGMIENLEWRCNKCDAELSVEDRVK